MFRIEKKIRAALTAAEAALIEFTSPSSLELDDSQTADSSLRERVADLCGWGGYSTGYGGFVFDKNYEPAGDWNDRTSRHHY